MTNNADSTPLAHAVSYGECSARERIARLFDAGSFVEWLPPSARVMSPHLAQLGVPSAFDDGVAIGSARLGGHGVFIAAQEGEFMGGGVGEVHGAKLVGLMQRAVRDKPAAVLLLAESGGVRLHEANAGLIAVSEVMRALLDVRAAGIPVIVLIGGANGCFGGMGIVARCADHLVMSDIGRLAMSGPEVIEASHGVEEFDSRDRALVWRTTGGKHRYLLGDCDQLVSDDVAAFRRAALAAVVATNTRRPMTLDGLLAEHALLTQRLVDGAGLDDAVDVWRLLGIVEAARVPDLDAAQVGALRAQWAGKQAMPGAGPMTTLHEALT
jgi:malonate decarboxylase beta subunit